MARNYPPGARVILTDTWQHGVAAAQNPSGTYKIRVTGRPVRAAQPDKRGRGPILARAAAPDFDRDDLDETVVVPWATPAQMDAANLQIRQVDVRSARPTQADRDELRFLSEDIVDADASTDHQINEAQRHLDALDQVELEDA